MGSANAYLWLKAVHVLAVAVWIGSLATMVELNGRAIRSGSRADVASFVEHSAFVGARIVGPAAGATLLAGIATMLIGRLDTTPWIWAGVGAFGLFVLLGVTVVRASSRRLTAAVRASGTSQAELGKLMRRVRRWSIVNLLVLTAAVVAMVFKPAP